MNTVVWQPLESKISDSSKAWRAVDQIRELTSPALNPPNGHLSSTSGMTDSSNAILSRFGVVECVYDMKT